MPPVSAAQRRLMWAAAGKKGGAGGVPQSVGKEFAKADPGRQAPGEEENEAAEGTLRQKPHLNMTDMAQRSAPMAEKPRKKKWVQKATENSHGQFRGKAESAGKSTREFAKEKESAPGKLGKEARLAETLMGMNKKRDAKSRRAAIYDNTRSQRHG